MVGSLVPRKNHLFLLRVFKRLVDDGHDIYLMIVGRGPEQAAIERTISELDLDGRVHLHYSAYTHRYKKHLMENCRLFVFPSLREGFGVALLEAMAHGMPIVASGIPAVREVVGDVGLLADPTDEAEFCERIHWMLNSPTLQEEMTEHGPRQAAVFQFSRSAVKLRDYYLEMLGK
jgi:glycosyltransferase involved in cell wall biosynthesis